jgi:RNA polymerase sigma-70 factor (ECF subfamily)
MATDRDMADFQEGNDPYGRFRTVFEELYTPLCQYAFTFLKNKDTCEDIVQEIFARIWEKNRYLLETSGKDIRYYLFAAVRNNCLTHLRKMQRMPVFDLTDWHLEGGARADWTEGSMEAEAPTDFKARLAGYIEQLPPKCREVFLLSRMGQLNNREVATALEISVKTVENQLWKAMKTLRSLAGRMNM